MMIWVIGYVVLMFVGIVCAHRFASPGEFDDSERFMVGLFWPLFALIGICAAFNAAAKWVARRVSA